MTTYERRSHTEYVCEATEKANADTDVSSDIADKKHMRTNRDRRSYLPCPHYLHITLPKVNAFRSKCDSNSAEKTSAPFDSEYFGAHLGQHLFHRVAGSLYIKHQRHTCESASHTRPVVLEHNHTKYVVLAMSSSFGGGRMSRFTYLRTQPDWSSAGRPIKGAQTFLVHTRYLSVRCQRQ
jgi:hypothetical protein